MCQVLTGFLWTLKTIFMVSHYSSRQALFSSALASGSIGNLIRDQLWDGLLNRHNNFSEAVF